MDLTPKSWAEFAFSILINVSVSLICTFSYIYFRPAGHPFPMHSKMSDCLKDPPALAKPILFVGLTCFDLLNYVDQFPEEDSDNRCENQVWTAGGNAANNCIVLSQLQEAYSHQEPGCPKDCHLLTTLTDDQSSAVALRSLEDYGVHLVDGCPVRKGQRLPVSTAIIVPRSAETGRGGSRTILHNPNDLVEITAAEFQALFPTAEALAKYCWIHFEGRNFGEVRKMMDYVLGMRMEFPSVIPAELRISVEIEKRRSGIEALIAGADVVYLSKTFALNRGYSNMEAAVRGISDTFCQPETLVICGWGELGSCACRRIPFAGETDGTNFVQVEACIQPETIDTLAAGDTFWASVVRALATEKWTVGDCLRFGSKVSGLKCSMRGFKGLREKYVGSRSKTNCR